MRKLFVMAMVAGLVAAGGFVRDARAGITVDLLFVGKNGSPIAPTDTVTLAPGTATGTLLTMAVRFSNSEGLTGLAFSLTYDAGFPAENELDPVIVNQWGGVPINNKGTIFFTPLAPVPPPSNTFIGSFNSTTNNPGATNVLPAGAGYQIGTIVWKVQTGDNNGADILSGFFNTGVDGATGVGFNNVDPNTVLFHNATVVVNVIPEPGTAALLSLGLVGLVLAGRRNRA